MSSEFEAWPKIYRKGKGVYVVTEKIDGTNAHVAILDIENISKEHHKYILGEVSVENDGVYSLYGILAGSRKRYITVEDDNYGFAKWVEENKEELLTMGEGRHYGEWAGEGIQKNPHNLTGKHFFLFNVARWGDHNPNTPECCSVVPIILTGQGIDTIDDGMKYLLEFGSMIGDCGEPEGVVAYNTFIKRYQKATFKSPNGKWEAE